jgi:EmrB/QacA subfamily drug resistance transporter
MSTTLHAYCDAARAHSVPPRTAVPRPALVLAATILASGLAFVDGSVVNVGLPAIGRSLGADAGALQWIVNAYLLPLSAFLLFGGAAGDRFGRGRLLILGIALFALASISCALAPGVTVLLASRFVQGIGAALVMPNSLALLGQTFSGESKGRAIGVWAATGAAAGAIGPVLGGGLIDAGSWRAIFLLNLPLAVGAILLAWRHVPGDADRSDTPLDWIGGLLVSAGLGVLTWALTVGSGQNGWTAGVTAAAVGSLGLLAAFIWVEHRRGDRAMMPLALFGSGRFVGLTLLTLFLYGALGALFVLIPYLLIEAGHYGATAAGAALLPLPVIVAIVSPVMGALAERVGSRLPLTIGPLGVAGGFLLALRIGTGASYWTDVLPAILLIAVGMGVTVAPLTTAVLNAVDPRHAGSASGFNSADARTGGLVATALLGSVLAAEGSALVSAFHTAMLVGAAACVAAGVSALVFIGVRPGGDQTASHSKAS